VATLPSVPSVNFYFKVETAKKVFTDNGLSLDKVEVIDQTDCTYENADGSSCSKQ
jgi:hypothetical protein